MGALYDFVVSCGEEVGFEEEQEPDFELLQNMPKKVFDDRHATIEQVGLFPRSMVIIKEK